MIENSNFNQKHKVWYNNCRLMYLLIFSKILPHLRLWGTGGSVPSVETKTNWVLKTIRNNFTNFTPLWKTGYFVFSNIFVAI